MTPFDLVGAYGLSTEFAQVVHEFHYLERSTLHLGKARLSNVDSHSWYTLLPLLKCNDSWFRVDSARYKTS
jgi:hypothetical protein